MKGALVYNYDDPYLYLMNYGFSNPSVSSGARGGVVNPAALASVKNASGVLAAGFGRRGGIEFDLGIDVPYLGELGAPVSLYAREASGVYYGAAAARIGELVLGMAYQEGTRFNTSLSARGEIGFDVSYSLRDTLTEDDIPGQDEETEIPIYIDLHGKGGGLVALESIARLKTTPFYLMLATQSGGIGYGVGFRWNNYSGVIDYTDTLTPVLSPTGAAVYSESDEWDVGVSLSAEVQGAELYSNKYLTTLTGNELGAVFGMQRGNEVLSWGFALEHDLGASILRVRRGSARRGGFPEIVEINTQNLRADADARILEGDMTVVLGYADARREEVDQSELLELPPRTRLRGGIHLTPDDWIIDASLAYSKVWGQGPGGVFLGTGFGYDWKIPIRFGQVIFYRVIKIEQMPIYSIPGLFFGVSATPSWKGLELDISVRANTTTALFANYAAAVDPDVPDLGILNYLSAGAAITYGF